MISVLIPVHNGEAFLLDALESVENQTFRNFEAVIVESESEDDSPAICDSWCRAHSRFRVIHKDYDRGVSVSRNEALAVARGEYIKFLDADDAYVPEALDTMYRVMEETEADVVCCGYSTFTGEAQFNESPSFDKAEPTVMTGREFSEGPMLSGDSHCWGKLFRRDVIGDRLFPEGITIGEDMLFVLSVMLDCRKAVTVYDYEGYRYRTNPQGAMLKPFTSAAMDQITCWEKAAEMTGHTDKMDSIIVTNAVLTASRIAQLPAEEKGIYKKELEECRKAVRRYYRPSVRPLLPEGYPAKTDLIRLSAGMYSQLYGVMTSGKNQKNE